jgi:hypothetical protein
LPNTSSAFVKADKLLSTCISRPDTALDTFALATERLKERTRDDAMERVAKPNGAASACIAISAHHHYWFILAVIAYIQQHSMTRATLYFVRTIINTTTGLLTTEVTVNKAFIEIIITAILQNYIIQVRYIRHLLLH